MKKTLFLFLLTILTINTNAQEIIFGGNVGGWGDDWSTDLDKTSDGSVLVSYDTYSRYWNSGEGYPGTYFGLSKYNKSGGLDWNFNYFRRTFFPHEYCILNTVVDEYDNSYSLIYIYQKTFPDTIDNIVSYPGMNLMKINALGQVQWFKPIGKTDDLPSILMYKNGNLYAVTTYGGDIKINNSIDFSSNKYYQCFMWMDWQGPDYLLLKYDTNGTLLNAVSLGEDYPDILCDATIDDDENIYFTGISDFFAGCINAYSHITKLDKNFNQLWKKVTSTQVNYEGMLNPLNIHLVNNKIYVYANIYNDVQTPDFTLHNPCYEKFLTGGFIIEYNTLDGTYLRHKAINNCTGSFNRVNFKGSYVNGFMDHIGNDLIVQTAFRGNLTLGDTVVSSDISYDNFNKQNVVLIKVNLSDLKLNHIQTLRGLSYDYFSNNAGTVVADGQQLYITGNFNENPLYISDYSISNNSANGNTDVYFAQLDMNRTTAVHNIQTEKTVLFPNPCSNKLKLKNVNNINKIEVFNMLGQKLKSIIYKGGDIDVSWLNSGTYMFVLSGSGQNVIHYPITIVNE